MCELYWLAARRVLRDSNKQHDNDVMQKYVNFLGQYVDTALVTFDSSTQEKVQERVWDEEHFTNLCDELDHGDTDEKFVSRISRNILDLVAGRTSVQELLFEDGLINDWYRLKFDMDPASTKLMRWLDLYAHKNPNLRILEVGAGTGGSTGQILETLLGSGTPRLKEYFFTDISSSFFEKAKDKFAVYGDRIQYRVLDLERASEEQSSFGTFDLIIGANVVHATSNLHSTLQNLRPFLKDDGKLVLYELATPENIYPGLLFGLFSGWWLSEEPWRHSGPIATIAQWDSVFRSAGFTGVDVSLDGFLTPTCKSAVLVTSITQTTVPNGFGQSNDTNGINIIISQGSNLQQSIAESIIRQIDEPCTIRLFDDDTDELEYGSRDDCIFLPSLEVDVLCSQTEQDFARLKDRLRSSRRLIWVYNTNLKTNLGPVNGGVAGLIRAATAEYSTSRLVAFGLTSPCLSSVESAKEVAELVSHVFKTTSKTGTDPHQLHFEERNGIIHIDRLALERPLDSWINERTKPRQPSLQPCSGKSLELAVGKVGMLESLRFVHTDLLEEPLASNEILIEVHAAGINFREVLVALGRYPGHDAASECAGIVTMAGPDSGFLPGERVACYIGSSIQTSVRCHAARAIRLPDWMTFTQGASWMLSFLSAYYSLITRAGLALDDGTRTILIHSGAGAFGQACIQIARMYDLEIFTTVSSAAKRSYLTERYNIPDDHIFNSRDGEFETGIKLATNANGVDIVVNSLSGELLQASWRCVAVQGRFIEIGKADVHGSGQLPMVGFKDNRSFLAVDPHICFANVKLLSRLQAKVLSLLVEGRLQLLETAIYPVSQVATAFQKLQSGQSVGKVVLEFGKDDMLQIVPQMRLPWGFDSESTYVISGAFGGIGRSLSLWMASRGAKYLILLGRHGAQKPESRKLLTRLEDLGVTVLAKPCDISKKEEIVSILQDAQALSMPPIKGCIQGAMVLEDISLEAMTLESWNNVISAKVHGSWYLHEMLPRDLDFFIILSSAGGMVGTYGQSNYDFASTYLDSLSAYRISQGEQAVSLDLGKIRSVGYVAEMEDTAVGLEVSTYREVDENELIAAIEAYCAPAEVLGPISNYKTSGQVMVGTPITPKTYFTNTGNSEPMLWMTQPFWRTLWSSEEIHSQSDNKKKVDAIADMASDLQKAKDLEEAKQIVQDGVVSRLKQMLGLADNDIRPDVSVADHGIDSLHAVELRTWIRRKAGADVKVFDLLGNTSLADLARNTAKRSSYVTVAC